MGAGLDTPPHPFLLAKRPMSDPEDHEPTSNRGALVALGVVAALILGGLWLSHVLGGAASVQDCVASGRTNCAPVTTGN
jgi:hypothetical protein